ncbi:MAG: hypothetical protein ACHP9Y_02215 [Gammaproteobacteria bacterium]
MTNNFLTQLSANQDVESLLIGYNKSMLEGQNDLPLEVYEGAFVVACGQGNVALITDIFNEYHDKLSEQAVSLGFGKVLDYKDASDIITIWNSVKSQVSSLMLGNAFIFASMNGRKDLVEKLWQAASDSIDEYDVGMAFYHAGVPNGILRMENQSQEIAMRLKLLELVGSDLKDNIANYLLRDSAQYGQNKVFDKVWEVASGNVPNEIIETALQNANNAGKASTASHICDLVASSNLIVTGCPLVESIQDGEL